MHSLDGLRRGAEVRSQAQYVAEDPTSCDFCAGAWAAHDEWLVLVSGGRECYYVVGAR